MRENSLKTLIIVCGADDNFARPLAITLYSAISHLNSAVNADLYILDGGISKKNKKRIEKVLLKRNGIKITWVTSEREDLDALKKTDIISRAAYLRILIPEILPVQAERAIYLDSDIIVRKDLTEIWDEPFDGNLALGVQDYQFPYVSSKGALSDYEFLGLQPKTPYCNSGLLVLNICEWRINSLSLKIIDYLKKTQKLDQDGINAVIGEKWKLLDPRWNVTLSSLGSFRNKMKLTSSEAEVEQANLLENAFVIHYTSRYKPWYAKITWDGLNYLYHHKFSRNVYFHYMKMSQWYSVQYFTIWVSYRKLLLTILYTLPRKLKIRANVFKITLVR
jgi:lipopolysaccharide biosynthesis glycosyltransferase